MFDLLLTLAAFAVSCAFVLAVLTAIVGVLVPVQVGREWWAR